MNLYKEVTRTKIAVLRAQEELALCEIDSKAAGAKWKWLEKSRIELEEMDIGT